MNSKRISRMLASWKIRRTRERESQRVAEMDRSRFIRGGAIVGLAAVAQGFAGRGAKAASNPPPVAVATPSSPGLVKPSFGLEMAPDGTLSARTAARMGGWFNAILDGGAKGDGVTNDFAALTRGYATSIALGLGFYFPPGNFNIGVNTLVFGGSTTGPISVRGVSGRTTITSTSGTANIVQIGNGIGSSTLEGGIVEGLYITGPSTPAVQSGQIGLLINGVTHVRVSKVEVRNTDIGFDMINNCYGAKFVDCLAGFGQTCNVGTNLRSAPGEGCGNQIVFDNCWFGGGIASYHISPSVDGINIRNGQAFCGNAGLGADSNGCIIAGKDYLTQTTGFTGTIMIDGVDMEEYLGWAVRLYGQANIVIRNCPLISNGGNSGTAAVQAQGVIKGTSIGNLSLRIENCGTRGYFNSAVAISLSGYGGGSYVELNSFTDNSYFDGVAVGTQSLFAQSGMTSGIAIFHDYTAGDMIYMGGVYLRPQSGGMQVSTDRATWTSLAKAKATNAYPLKLTGASYANAANPAFGQGISAGFAQTAANWKMPALPYSTVCSLSGFTGISAITVIVGQSQGWFLAMDASGHAFAGTANGGVTISTTVNVADGRHHTMRLDNGLTTATLYVDGVIAGSATAGGSSVYSPIGFRRFPGGNFHAADGNGVVSSVAIYSALGGTLVPSSEVSAGDPNLIVGWQLNGSGISVP